MMRSTGKKGKKRTQGVLVSEEEEGSSPSEDEYPKKKERGRRFIIARVARRRRRRREARANMNMMMMIYAFTKYISTFDKKGLLFRSTSCFTELAAGPETLVASVERAQVMQTKLGLRAIRIKRQKQIISDTE